MALSIKYSIGNYPSLRLVLKKNRPEKFPFYRNKELNCIGCSIVCKISFCSEFPDIPDEAGRKTRRRTQTIAKRYAFHANVTGRRTQAIAKRYAFQERNNIVIFFYFSSFKLSFISTVSQAVLYIFGLMLPIQK